MIKKDCFYEIALPARVLVSCASQQIHINEYKCIFPCVALCDELFHKLVIKPNHLCGQ